MSSGLFETISGTLLSQPLTELRADSAEETLFALQRAYEVAPENPLDIDLTSIRRWERLAGSLLSNMLIGTLGDAALVLSLPTGERLDWLTASGLAFAVANRHGSSVLSGPVAREADRWRLPWSTAAAGYWRKMHEMPTLFPPDAASETTVLPDLLGRNYAAFVDAHLSPIPSGPSHPLTDVVWPWLDRLLPRHRDRRRRQTRDGFIDDVGRIVAETVGNVREHAARGVRPLHSLVQLAMTRGGGVDRLHLIVQDNGPGIAATARPKIDRARSAALADHQLLFKLCDGSLAPWGRARGEGLPVVREKCLRLGGTMQVWTKTTRVGAAVGVPPLTSGDGLTRFDGTVIGISLPMPA